MRDKKGFTLIEVVFTAAILASISVSIIAAYIVCFELVSVSRNTTFAVNAAQERIEEMRGYDFYSIHDDYDNETFTVAEITSGPSRGVIYVDNTNPDLIRATVSVCWRQNQSRVIGEDADLDGVLDGGEDANDNDIIDSPVQMVTLITQR